MAVIFLDGFDTYANRVDATAGMWAVGSFATSGAITTGRLGDYAANMGQDNLGRAFAASDTMFIGAAVKFADYGIFGANIFQFVDSTSQIQIQLTVDTFGRLLVYRGSGSSHLIGITTNYVPLNTWNYVEFGINIGTGTSGAFTVRVNDQVVLQNSACNTQATTDTTVSAVYIGGAGNQEWDDLYIADASGSVNNSFLGDMRVETLLPASDVSVDLTPINSMGNNLVATSGLTLQGPNVLYVYRVYCQTNGTVPTGYITYSTANLTAKTKMVIYNDGSGGTLGTLLTNGVSNEVIGVTASNNIPVAYTFGTPPTVTAGTHYWLGYITDTQVWGSQNAFTAGISASIANTYASGAPSTPTVSSYGTDSPQMAVEILSGTNWSAVNDASEDQDYSYVYSNNPGDSDLYTFDSLTADSQTVYAVQVAPMIRKTHTAARNATASIKTPTMSTANSSTLAPGVNYAYFPTVFNHQSDGSTTWTVAAVNGIEAGITVG